MMKKTIYRNRIRRASIVQGKEERFRTWIDYGILALIIFSPLPAASVYPWATTAIALAAVILAVFYFMLEKRPSLDPGLSRSLKRPGLFFAGFFIFVLFQIMPLPVFVVRLLSPHSMAFRQQFAYQIGKVKFLTLSLVPYQTLREGLELFSCFLIGFLIIKTVTTKKQIWRILIVLVSMGFFEAVYGIAQLNRTNPWILFYKKTIKLDKVTGTFINPNHLAGYLEMIIPLVLGLVIAHIDLLSMAGKSLREKLMQITEKNFAFNLILMASLFVMVAAVLLTGSRTGLFLMVLTFVLFWVFSFFYFGTMRHRKSAVKTALQIMSLILVLLFIYVGIGSTLERFSPENIYQGGRLHYGKNTLQIIKDFPVFGIGMGTFAFVYPAYEHGQIYAFLVHAENDYLEYASELGVLGFLLLSGALFFLIGRAFSVWKRRRNPEIKGLALGGIISLIAIAAHSITDFNLHIPANRLLFAVICSLTIVIVHYRYGGKGRRTQSGEPTVEEEPKETVGVEL